MKQQLRLRRTGGKTVLEAEIAWKLGEDPKASRFVAVCPALNIALHAHTREELFSLIPESMESLFASLEKHGDWDAFLQETKWTRQESRALEMVRSKTTRLPPLRLQPVPSDDLQLAACG